MTKKMKTTTLQITRTAVFLALLIVLQAVTKPLGQLITGSCVNAVLAATALFCGVWPGVVVALISPFAAFLLGIGPQLFAITPAIALGNVVYAVLMRVISGNCTSFLRQFLAWLASAVSKTLILYFLVVELICTTLPLSAAQISTFTMMFSWPQLATALIGGGLATAVAPVVLGSNKHVPEDSDLSDISDISDLRKK